MNLTLDPQGVPTWHGDPLCLPPKERAVLTLLLRAQDQIVSKQDIIDGAWGGAAVADASLVRCVSQIRRVLPEVQIESVYGQGYRLRQPTAQRHGRALAAALGPPPAVESFQHALMLSQSHTPRAMARALQVLRAVVAEYPDYVPPRVALARVIGVAVAWGMAQALQVGVDDGFTLLAQASAQAPAEPGLLSVRAWLLDLDWRFDQAQLLYEQASLRQADDVEAMQLQGWHWLACGLPQAALALFQRVLALRPFAAFARVMVARCLMACGDEAAALHEARQAWLEHPDDAVVGSFCVAVSAAIQPESALIDQARALAQQADASPYARGMLPYVLARCGRRAQAHGAIDTLLATADDPGSGLLVVSALDELGEFERACALLEAAAQARCGLLPLTLRLALTETLLRQPRVAQVLQGVFARLPG